MISIVIPVRNGGEDLRSCLAGIERQQIQDDIEVVVIDFESTDGSAEMARAWGARVHVIRVEEFNHGRARNLGAELARGEILVFTTQDAYAESRDGLSHLTRPLRNDARLAGVYGRQRAKSQARPVEEYFLDFLYGPNPREQRVRSPNELTMEVTLFSNVNSAIPRRVWNEFPFAEDLIMSEDQEWCTRGLLAGYTVRYAPRAAVRHSHDYTIQSAFQRFFDSGVSAEHAYLAAERASLLALRRTALRCAASELRWLWRTGRRR